MLPSWLPPVVIAPVIGSFLGVLVRRLPEGRKIVWGRSCCEACGRKLGWSEMIPVASFLARRGACRGCSARIAPEHLWIELAALAVAIWAATSDEGARLWVDCGLGWTLLALSWIDAKHMLLPDALTLPLIPAGLAWTAYAAPDLLADSAVGAVAGYGVLRVVGILYRQFRGRDGLGQGDAKLLAASGAWLGWQGLGPVVLAAALGGLGAAAIAALAGRRIGGATALPFGPFLAGATWLSWLYLT